jgi:putative oxidoreductase
MIVRLRRLILSVCSRLRWLPPLVARVTLGLTFLQTGWGKLHNIAKVTDFFTQLGLPAPGFQARLVATTEFVCGALLLLGLLTRLASLPLLATMIVAIATAKRGDVHELGDLFGMSEYLCLVLLLWLAAFGAGLVSIDAAIAKRLDARP